MIKWYGIIGCLSVSVNMVEGQDVGHTDPPNIVLFYADDLGWMDLGVQGSPYYETPSIDRMAREGIRFTQAYANAANCAPSRASLMTGLYPPGHGIYTVASSSRGKDEWRKLIPIENTEVLHPELLTIAEYLGSVGYNTSMAGKWHLSRDPLGYGFDVNFGGYEAGHPESYFSPYENPALPDGPDGEHLPDRLATEVVHWIGENHENPFFVYFPFYSVHTPIQARANLQAKYASKEPGKYHNKPAYAAMIEAMDQAAGRVMETLDSLDLADNTIVIFTSDNGAHGGQTLSRPLRGAKGMYYEGGIRVPMIVKWPGVVDQGKVLETPVSALDLFPTFVEVSGGVPDGMGLDGVSLFEILKGGSMDDRALFWHFPAYLESYKGDRAGEDSHDKPLFRTTPCSAVLFKGWKLIHYHEDDDIELFNLDEDIGESLDLSEIRNNKRQELMDLLKQWLEKTNAPIPTELNPVYDENSRD